MRIVSLLVENFRAIRKIELLDLTEMIVIAGPNGCGKSCILDSIRLFKSVYGGYQPNEWQQWLGEFQIDFQRNPQQMASLLRDGSRPSVIEATIELSADEINFIKSRLRPMLEEHVWKTIVPGLSDPWLRARGALAAELRAHKPAVDQRVVELMPQIEQLLNSGVQKGRLEIHPGGAATTRNNILLELVFSSFYPKHIGVIDYHGSHRNYGREQLGGINLNLDNQEDQFRASSLYNYGNKYTNIKSEMAAEYVRQALQEKKGIKSAIPAKNLSDTLQDLFTIFFPGKKFLGPVPTESGTLDFPVEIEGGGTHDINELSSGEKEVLFGYLRLRNSAPRYSVILLDEPELHLNPALIRGLPQFYHRNLGLELNNQIWLVTHSDAFLREAVGHAGVRVLHMQYASAHELTENQVHEIKAGEEVEAIVIELVGDLAAYRPGAKVVFFEGENSDFDLKMVSRFFPDLEKRMNFISGGTKYRVEMLHRTLERSILAGNIPIKVYSVVDRDSELAGSTDGEFRRHFSWDVYHIENYLLEPTFICEALKQIGIYRSDADTEQEIELRLKEIAKNQIGRLVSHKVRVLANKEIVGSIELSVNATADDIGEEMHRAVIRSRDRVSDRVDSVLGIDRIREMVEKERGVLVHSLEDDSWRKHFKGRDILSVFAGKYASGMRYEYFRDLIISSMVNGGYQPVGMRRVLDSIAND